MSKHNGAARMVIQRLFSGAVSVLVVQDEGFGTREQLPAARRQGIDADADVAD